mmetsp:Transcript_25261/g.64373  ORF Transcript_25261/g.64373 Transcript_25261/m.64373 type:complete len:206 (+) Transcript_25261:187-804(+)
MAQRALFARRCGGSGRERNLGGGGPGRPRETSVEGAHGVGEGQGGRRRGPGAEFRQWSRSRGLASGRLVRIALGGGEPVRRPGRLWSCKAGSIVGQRPVGDRPHDCTRRLRGRGLRLERRPVLGPGLHSRGRGSHRRHRCPGQLVVRGAAEGLLGSRRGGHRQPSRGLARGARGRERQLLGSVWGRRQRGCRGAVGEKSPGRGTS